MALWCVVAGVCGKRFRVAGRLRRGAIERPHRLRIRLLNSPARCADVSRRGKSASGTDTGGFRVRAAHSDGWNLPSSAVLVAARPVEAVRPLAATRMGA